MSQPQTTTAMPVLIAGLWDIDPGHSSVEFLARHLLSRVRGRFTDFAGTIEVGVNPAHSAAEVTIQSASIDTDHEDRDGHLRGPDLTKPVSLEVEYLGWSDDPWGGKRAAFSARTEIDRDDFGANWNMVLETGGLLVGKRVQIELEIEAVLRTS